jgi:hypothetical protein
VTRQPSPVAMLQRGPLEEQYRHEGYVDYRMEIDAQVCAEVACECGAPKTRYVGLWKPAEGREVVDSMFGRRPRGTYRALSHCDVCGLEVEF